MSKRSERKQAELERLVQEAVRVQVKDRLTAVAIDRLAVVAKDVAAREFDAAFVARLRDDALANIAADPNIIGVVRGLAHDIAEDAAKSYVMHILGAAITVELGAVVDGAVIAGGKPLVPPL